jgi:hypothetical protein
MRTVTTRPSFQGDLVIRRVDKMPKGLKCAAPENGFHILAHSETGHHHVVDANLAQRFIDDTNTFIAFLEVTMSVALDHKRDFDTHEPLLLEPGIYEVRQQREYVAEGFRRAAD